MASVRHRRYMDWNSSQLTQLSQSSSTSHIMSCTSGCARQPLATPVSKPTSPTPASALARRRCWSRESKNKIKIKTNPKARCAGHSLAWGLGFRPTSAADDARCLRDKQHHLNAASTPRSLEMNESKPIIRPEEPLATRRILLLNLLGFTDDKAYSQIL